MYKVLFEVKTKAKTLKGINEAIKKETGDSENWFDSIEEFEQSKKEGFTTVAKSKITLLYDGI